MAKYIYCWLLAISFVLGNNIAALANIPAYNSNAFQKLAFDSKSNISQYRLKSNNLDILLVPRHATPVVTSMVVYHVGSRNEAVGYTGSTHFLEHMLFKGTNKHDPLKFTGIDDLLKPTGGFNNASTFYDRTNYYEVAPSGHLALCLELEADRMRNALLRNSDRKSEMTVVRNELERNEDDARNLLDTNVFAAAFKEHPYHHPVIGWRSDVENVPTERLRKFYQDFYTPNNATLIVIGDFENNEVLGIIDKYFSSIKASSVSIPPVYTVEPPQEGQRRFYVQRGDDLPKVMIGFHVPAAKDKDTYALEVIASLLGDERRHSSRLYKSIVDSGLASEVYAANYSLHDPGLFVVFATACPGVSLNQLEEKIISEINTLIESPVDSGELNKAKISIWKRLNIAAADPLNMADQLTESIATVNWQWWVGLTDKIKAVSIADVSQVAKKYFDKKNSTVGYYFPRSEKNPSCAMAVNDSQISPNNKIIPLPSEPNKNNFDPGSTMEIYAKNNKSTSVNKLIAKQIKRYVLKNGLTLLVLPIANCKVVSIAGKTLAGSYFRSPELTLVPDLLADMLNKGSAGWTKESMALELELLGTGLEFDVGHFWLEFNSELMSEDLKRFLPLLADVLKNPKFDQEELDKVKHITEAKIVESEADTKDVALNEFLRTEYDSSCVYYEKPFEEQKSELKNIVKSSLQEFHQKYVIPNGTVIAIAGDINPEYAFSLVEKCFSDWSAGEAKKVDFSNGKSMVNYIPGTIFSNLSDKTNIDVLIGQPVDVGIKSKDFFAFQIANAVLGYDTISSRLAEIRQKYGFTYGISSYLSDNCYQWAPWLIELSVNPENYNKALALVNSTVAKLAKEGISQKELDEEAKRLAGQYIVGRLRTPAQIADGLAKYELLGLGPNFIDNYAKELKSVKISDVKRAISKYFVINSCLTSAAGSPLVDNSKPKKIGN